MRSSRTSAPRDQISDEVVRGVWEIDSGDIQYGDPTMEEEEGPPARVATPKSATAQSTASVLDLEGVERGLTLDATFLRRQDIPCFDISMNHTLIVEVREPL